MGCTAEVLIRLAQRRQSRARVLSLRSSELFDEKFSLVREVHALMRKSWCTARTSPTCLSC